jgi:Flp pilus assembly protein TadD
MYRGAAIAMLLVGTMTAQDADALYQTGIRLLSENQMSSATDALEKCVRLRPDYAAAWKALGVISATRGEFDRAEKPFRTACELQPGLADACSYYGRTLYLLNQFQPALEVLRRASGSDPNNSQLHRLIALCLEALGETSEASRAFQKAIQLNRGSLPNDDPGIDYGVFLYRQGRAEDAVEPLESSTKRHPDASRAHLELGCVLLALNRVSEAEAHLERAVALDPQSGRSHLLLGKVYMRLGKDKEGEEQLRQGSLNVK